ncbi:hypothetical protein [Roseiconus lacunae]|uniref:hypothetical protein n=1 Tax=Roseiconus lacunae TaxID=2605694 RepID=UPI001E3C7F3F|nr:hypothetical protein [Roseiconus lacunae]MCD0460502.1 hypothetical protein [Roseiconus lacunae]
MEDFTQSQHDSLQSELFLKGFASASTEQMLGRTTSIPANSPIEFRVVRPGSPVRRLRLTGNRYTFGSGDGCSIRLEDESLRPMHAVMLRDAHRVLMRAYSIPLELNGDRVTESDLRVGDVIRMGDYRFELLDAPIPADDRPRIRPRLTQASSTHRPPANDSSAMRERLAELSQQWHTRHAECEIRETRCDNRESALHGRETELWKRASDLQRRESKLVAQEAAVREIQQTYEAAQDELKSLRQREQAAGLELAAKEAELEQLQDKLVERQQELERRQAEWQKREEQYAERAAEAQQQLEQSQSQAKSASDAIGRMRTEFATLNEQLTELRERHSSLQQRERDEQEEHERLRAELESARDQAIRARDEAIEARAISEAARAAKETELDRAAETLASTRRELEDLREESQAAQKTLEDKLQSIGDELTQARDDAKSAHQQSGEFQELLEIAANKETDLEQSVAKFEDQVAEYQLELEAIRKQAAEDQQAAVRECEKTTARIAELEQQLADLRESNDDQASHSDERVSQLQEQFENAESERLTAENNVASLRSEIAELNESLAKAKQEADRWQGEFDGANASIRQLELLVDQNQNSQTAQQDSWVMESEQLQNTINELSIQLSGANAELSQLRDANDALTRQLSDANSEPENTAGNPIESQRFAELESALQQAREDIELLKNSHAETVAKLESDREASESALREEIQQLQDEIAAAQKAATEASEFASTVIEDDAPTWSDETQPQSPERQHSDVTGETFEDTASSDDRSGEDVEMSDAESSDAISAELQEAEEMAAASVPAAEAYYGQDTDSVINLDSVVLPDSDALSDSEEISGGQESTDAEASTEEDSPHWRTDGASEDNVGWPAASAWSDQTPSADALDANLSGTPEADQPHWTDESPEQAISGAIDDLEHRVQKAIESEDAGLEIDAIENDAFEPGDEPVGQADVDDQAWTDREDNVQTMAGRDDQLPQYDVSSNELIDQQSADSEALATSVTTETDPDQDQPLSWSDFMPGEASQATGQFSSDGLAPEDAEGLAEQTSEADSEIPAEAPVDSMDEASAEVDPAEDSVVDVTNPWQPLDLQADSNELGKDDQPTQMWQSEASKDAVPAEDLIENPSSDSPVGGLAEMLIRDLDAEREQEHFVSEGSVDQAAIEQESENDPTFVMADQPGESDGGWNFASSQEEYQRDEENTDEPAEYDEESSLEASPDTAALNTTPTVAAAEPAPEDDSIEAYMSRLLQRVQGGPAPAPEPAPKSDGKAPAVKAESKLKQSDFETTFDSQADEPKSATNEPSVAAPLVPRSQAPELKKNLSAMRDLANQSARNAVARSIRIQARDTQMNALWKALLAGAFVLMAIGVFIFVSWSSTIKLVMIGAFLTLSAVFGQEAFVLARDARRRLKLADGTIDSDDLEGAEEIAQELRRIAESGEDQE